MEPRANWSNKFRIVRRPHYPIEVVLIHIIKELRDKRLPINQSLIRVMAGHVYELLSSRVNGRLDFNKPSFGSGWLAGFRKYWGITHHKMKGEAGSVIFQSIEKEIDNLKDALAGYDLCNIYNADETGLFLQTLSSWTLDLEKLPGTKSASSRVSILLCTNADGSDKRKPLILSNFLFFSSKSRMLMLTN